MSIEKAVPLGLAGNELSKEITGTDEVSAERTTVAAAAGGTLGLIATEAIVISAPVVAPFVAPVVVPLAVASGIVAGIASLFG